MQADHSDENQDQLFACCGEGPTSSLRTIRAGISAERLLSTPPAYEGVAGTWAMRMSAGDPHHAFLVMSFVGETRVLSVGLSFDDVTVRKPAVLAYAPRYKRCATVLLGCSSCCLLFDLLKRRICFSASAWTPKNFRLSRLGLDFLNAVPNCCMGNMQIIR